MRFHLLILTFTIMFSSLGYAQMPAVGSNCDTGANAGSMALGNIGGSEIALLVCDKKGSEGGKYVKWASVDADGALTVEDLTVKGDCDGCGGGSSSPLDVKQTTASTNGDLGGYLGLQSFIESNGCSGYRVCTYDDLHDWALLLEETTPTGFAWANEMDAVQDCEFWSSSDPHGGSPSSPDHTPISLQMIYQIGGIVSVPLNGCDQTHPVWCCKGG